MPSAWSPSRLGMKVGTSDKPTPATHPAPCDSPVAPVYFLHWGRPWLPGLHRVKRDRKAYGTGGDSMHGGQEQARRPLGQRRPVLVAVSEDAVAAGQFRLCWA